MSDDNKVGIYWDGERYVNNTDPEVVQAKANAEAKAKAKAKKDKAAAKKEAAENE